MRLDSNNAGMHLKLVITFVRLKNSLCDIDKVIISSCSYQKRISYSPSLFRQKYFLEFKPFVTEIRFNSFPKIFVATDYFYISIIEAILFYFTKNFNAKISLF